ncbi:SlyX family protein [Hydrogenophaga sp. RWCD_12]|uniref:SlyX family protein n=1 Tax=Hydrogenophaga sp. RWCD_12 TaxID=3391190 RepID=UPI0039854DA5
MSADTDERLAQLEIKISYLEDLVDTLNTMVAKQHDQIARLAHEVGSLRQRQDESQAPGFRSLRDELPPHY